MGGTIILPSIAKRSIKYVCTVPVGRGEVCNHPFFEDEERVYVQHVCACSERHEAESRAESMREKMPGFFGPLAGDAEYENWVRRNARAILEGRVKM